jgi:hypothetical protein
VLVYTQKPKNAPLKGRIFGFLRAGCTFLSAGFLSFCGSFWRFAKHAQIDRPLSEIEKLGDNIALRALSETFRPARLVRIFTDGQGVGGVR